MNRYDNIVDMAESGDTEAYVGPKGRGVWRRTMTGPPDPADWVGQEDVMATLQPCEVLVPPQGGECYVVHDLLTDERLREAVKRTAEMRRRLASA